ncbi:hypothetical protein GGS21DRAFT_46546 [Xylaria nigripes]|nr:hypothetical protein GGS21DRAFT_46546 [Xylaria nigripes]
MPLQKPFSEQNGSLKTRQRWHKSKTHPAARESSNSTKPRHPLDCVSESAKNKLNSFNFCPPAQDNQSEEPAKRAVVDDGDNLAMHEATSSLPSNPTSDSKKHLSTPVNRLAWHDLIGEPDTRGEDVETSPLERIVWDTKQKPMYSVSPMPRKRGVKRARSSSPLSSPAASTKSIAPAVNVKKLSAALKSPRADPAIELWNRFSVGGSTTITSFEVDNPALAQIIGSSSPQPPKCAGSAHSEGSLRRAISCGANWPKRRRTERTELAHSTSFTAGVNLHSNAKSSMVNALLESVTGELNRSKAVRTHLDALKSPSPPKKRYNPADHLSGSPNPRSSSSKSMPYQMPEAAGASEEVDTADKSSDYGDDDFDDDALINLEVDISLTSKQDPRPTQPQTPVSQRTKGHNITAPGVYTLEEEYADLDDDLLAAAGDLLTQIDSAGSTCLPAPTVQVPIPVNATSQAPDSGGLAEDTYEDDFGGDFDFEAAELAATQSVKKPGGLVPLVCVSET